MNVDINANKKLIKVALENFKANKTNKIEGWFNAQQKRPTAPWVYNNIFPEYNIPNISSLRVNTGAEISQVQELESLGFVKVIDEVDYFITDEQKMGKEWVKQYWAHPMGYLLSVEFNQEFLDESSTNYHNTNDLFKKIKLANKIGVDEVFGTSKKSKHITKDSLFLCDEVEMFYPGPLFRDEDFHQEMIKNIWKIIAQNEKEGNVNSKEKAEISILVKDQYDTYFKPFDLTRFSPDLKSANVFYGDGFEDFHDKLVKRVTSTKKGLVLLHGDPGTGKTHYIRHLLKVFTGANKRVIFIPSMLIEEMANPETINFLVDDIISSNKDTILLMEDAELLLESRKNNGGRTMGISNLLNSTDGILNDLLGIVIIATFNTDLENIDEALLRSGRLLARKNFKCHDAENAVRIAEELDIAETFAKTVERNKKYSIADIISTNTDNETLIHDLESRSTIGFKR